MALTPVKIAAWVAFLGIASFILGIIAELKKPAAGEVIHGKSAVLCNYKSDKSVLFGYMSTAFLVAASFVGYQSLFYAYKGKSVPKATFFSCRWCLSYISVAAFTSVFAAVFLIWPTVQGILHRTRNIHFNLHYDCPTAKTGLLGGGAFMSLNASILWLVALMLTTNVREDYFEEAQEQEMI